MFSYKSKLSYIYIMFVIVLLTLSVGYAHDYIVNGGTTDAEKPSIWGKIWNPLVNMIMGGDPVYLVNGEYILSVGDLSLSGRKLDLGVVRYYTSMSECNSRFGYGWDMNYNMKVRKLHDDNEIVLLDGCNGKKTYTRSDQGSSIFNPPSGNYDYLFENVDGTFTLKKKDGLKCDFDINGNLISINDEYGNQISFQYDIRGLLPIEGASDYFIGQSRGVVAMEFMLIKITDDLGNEVLFDYYEDGESGPLGLLQEITDTAGRKWSYSYDSNTNDLLTVTGPETVVDVDGVPTSMRLTWTYTYENHQLKTITDSAGQTYVSNVYDEQGRVWKQTYGEAYYEFSYDSEYDPVLGYGVTTITDRKGYSKEVKFNEMGGAISEKVFTDNLRSTDPSHYQTTKEFNSNLEITKIVNPDGKCIAYQYDSNGNLEEICFKPSETIDTPNIKITTTYTTGFDATDYRSNLLRTITDPESNVTTFTYDFDDEVTYGSNIGNLMKITNPTVGSQTPEVSFTYNSYGQLETMTSADNILTKYEYYDNQASDGVNYGRLKKVILDEGTDSACLNLTTQFEYDALGNTIKVTNANNEITEMLYNDLNQLVQAKTPAPFSNITEYKYGKNKMLSRVQRALGADTQIIRLTYNILDKVREIKDPHWNSASPTEHIATLGYDYNENLNLTTDAENNSITKIFDERNLLWKVFDANGEAANPQYFTEYFYTLNGKLGKIVDANGNETTYNYDEFDRLKKVEYPENADAIKTTQEFSYDDNSNITYTKSRSGSGSHYSYDALNRLEYSVCDSEPRAITLDNGGVGTSFTGTWLSSNATGSYLDSGALYSTNSGDVYQYSIDLTHSGEFGVFIWLTNNDGTEGSRSTDVAVQIWDDDTHQEAVVNIDQSINGGKWCYLGEYDFTDADKRAIIKIISSGSATTCADAARVVPITSYKYDIAGRVTEVNDGSDITAFETTTDRLKRVTKITDPESRNIGYDYDNLSRVVQLSYPDDQTMDAGSTEDSYVNYHYDSMGRFDYVEYTGYDGITKTIASYVYDDLSRRKSITLGNGTKMVYGSDNGSVVTGGFDLANRLENFTNIFSDGLGGYKYIHFDYSYDDVGNCLSRTIDSGTTYDSYVYDNIYQLWDVSFADGSSFDYHDASGVGYDPLGNRTTVVFDDGSGNQTTTSYTSSGNELNQYDTVDTADYSYDDNGNLVGIDYNNDGTDDYVYQYDYKNRLISVAFTELRGDPAVSYDISIEYGYDYQSRRISKKVTEDDGNTPIVTFDTLYAYSGQRVIAEYDYDDTAGVEAYVLSRKFIYGPGIDEPICMLVLNGSGGEDIYYYHYDGRASVIALSNSTGQTVERYSYLPFGATTIYDSPGTDLEWFTSDDVAVSGVMESDLGNSYMFTGRRFDPETGIYYYRARMYDPQLGRFLQTDPIGYADGMNVYAYVGNNPVNWIDPLGEFRFGNRALNSSTGKFIWNWINSIPGNDVSPLFLALDVMNLDFNHEQGFFEDGSHQNVGFFGPDVLRKNQGVLISTNDQSEHPNKYEISPFTYDDVIMRQAMQNVNNSGAFDPEDYKLMGSEKNNCQDYATALRKEYRRLGGKVKYRPFRRRSRF